MADMMNLEKVEHQADINEPAIKAIFLHSSETHQTTKMPSLAVKKENT